MKKKMVQILAGFFVLMCLFTMLSRAADSMGIPNVTTAFVQRMSVSHTVTAQGKVEQNREQAVFTEPGQRVKAIYIEEGQKVEKGELLFELDMEELEEQIVEAKQELEKQDLQTGDSESAKDVAAARRAASQQRASSDYSEAKSEGDRIVEKARQELEDARSALETYKDGKLHADGKDAVAEELKKADKEKEKAWEKAKKKYEELEKERNERIASAVKDAQNQAERGENSASSPEDMEWEAIEAEIEMQYQGALQDAKEEAEHAQKEAQNAKQAWEEYQRVQKEAEKEADDAAKEELQAAVEEKQQAYEEAVRTRENSLRNAGNAVEDASIPDARDSSVEVAAIERGQKERELAKLEMLKEANGQVKSPIPGVVTKISVTTGERTGDGTAVLLADLSAGCRFVAQITKEEEKYVARKDKVSLTVGKNAEKLEGLEVASVRMSEEDQDMREVTVNLEADLLEMGVAAVMEIEPRTAAAQSVLPISALHYDNSQAYVLVIQESQTVLGTEMTARRVDVTILDKNEKYAAIQEGVVTSEQKVIQSSDRNVEPGGRVRLAEE